MKVTRAFLDIQGAQLHYRVAGAGEPLLLLHRSARSSDEFTELMPILAKERLALAMDIPGYGDSDKPPWLSSMADFAKTVIMLLDSLDIRRTSIVGHHTGALVGIEVAAAYPERVDRLVLSYPVPLLNDEARRGFRASILGVYKRFEGKPDGSHLTEMWRYFDRGKAGVELRNRLLVDHLKATGKPNPVVPLVYVEALGNYRMEERLPLIQCPTLVIWTTQDLEHHIRMGFHPSQSSFDAVGGAIRGSKVVEIRGPQATTEVTSLMPNEFAGLVLEFLKG